MELKKNWKWLLAGAAGVAIIAYAASADAADLGGNCCADLEERIAELETTVARKGNRKVSLVVAGQLNKAIFWYDADDFGLGSDTAVIENGTSESYVTITGAALVRPGWWAGYALEIGQGTTGLDVNLGLGGATADIVTDNGLYTRQSYAFIKSEELGTISLGLQSMATDDLSHQNVARTDAASKRLTFQPLGGVKVSILGVELIDVPLEPFNGRKANSVRYTSPTVAGFVASAAWSSDDDSWDVALRYAGEFGGFGVVAGAGYYDDKTTDILQALEPLTGPLGIGSTTLTVNGGVKHMTSGLFVQGTWSRLDFDNPINIQTDAWHVQAGIENRFFDVGHTTLWGEYSEWNDLDLTSYGLGVNQQLGPAVDLYAIGKRTEIGGGEIDTVTSGIRIRF